MRALRVRQCRKPSSFCRPVCYNKRPAEIGLEAFHRITVDQQDRPPNHCGVAEPCGSAFRPPAHPPRLEIQRYALPKPTCECSGSSPPSDSSMPPRKPLRSPRRRQPHQRQLCAVFTMRQPPSPWPRLRPHTGARLPIPPKQILTVSSIPTVPVEIERPSTWRDALVWTLILMPHQNARIFPPGSQRDLLPRSILLESR